MNPETIIKAWQQAKGRLWTTAGQSAYNYLAGLELEAIGSIYLGYTERDGVPLLVIPCRTANNLPTVCFMTAARSITWLDNSSKGLFEALPLIAYPTPVQPYNPAEHPLFLVGDVLSALAIAQCGGRTAAILGNYDILAAKMHSVNHPPHCIIADNDPKTSKAIMQAATQSGATAERKTLTFLQNASEQWLDDRQHSRNLLAKRIKEIEAQTKKKKPPS